MKSVLEDWSRGSNWARMGRAARKAMARPRQRRRIDRYRLDMVDLLVASSDRRGNPGFPGMDEGHPALNYLGFAPDGPEIRRVLVIRACGRGEGVGARALAHHRDRELAHVGHAQSEEIGR